MHKRDFFSCNGVKIYFKMRVYHRNLFYYFDKYRRLLSVEESVYTNLRYF